MTIYKSRDIIANIRAKDVNIGDIGAKFYTEDDLTGSIGIHVRHKYEPFDFAKEGYKPIFNLFLEDGSVLLNEDVEVFSERKGYIQYNISEEVIKHVGKVWAKLFLKNDSGESIHVIDFRFDIVSSGIQEAVERVVDVKLLDDVFKKFIEENPDIIKGEKGSVVAIVDGKWNIDGEDTGIVADVTKAPHTHKISDVTGLQTELDKIDGKLDKSHASDTSVHITSADRKIWDGKISQLQADNRYAQKDDVYSKTEADNKYATKSEAGNVDLTGYQKTSEADAKYAAKSHAHTTADISDFNSQMAKKADLNHNHDATYAKIGTSYTKAESDGKYGLKDEFYSKSVSDGKYVDKPSLASEMSLQKLYVQSRGENLVTNGTGLMGDNTNFKDFTFVTDEVKVGGGSFKSSTRSAIMSDEYIPVDTTKSYELSAWAKTKNGTSEQYFGHACYDIDKNGIMPENLEHGNLPPAKLVKPLKKGDTVIYLDSVENWTDENWKGLTLAQKGIILWGYKNSGGYQYPDKTYSRYSQINIKSIDAENNTITLNSPLVYDYKETSDKAFPVGHTISRTGNGSGYNYSVLVGQTVPKVWTKRSAIITGIGDKDVTTAFRYGTAFIRTLFLTNYSTDDEIFYSGIDLKEVDITNYATAGHNHDLTYIKKADGQTYKLFKDDGLLIGVDKVDLNNPEAKLTKSGTYYCTSATNYPAGTSPSGYVTYEVFSTNSYAKLYYSPYHASDVYMKTKYATWGDWVKLNNSSADLSNYYDKSQLYTKLEVDANLEKKGTAYTKAESDGKYELKGTSYSKSEVDSKIATAQTGGTVDLSAYQKTADADSKYAAKTHTHTTAQVTGLDTALAGKAPTSHTHTTSQITDFSTEMAKKADKSHTHAIADVTDLQTTLDNKLNRTTADTLYALKGETTGGTVTVGANVINANKKFGFVGDGVTDNYQPFKDMLAFNKANPYITIEFDGEYNNKQAEYRVDRYVTISSIEGNPTASSPTHMIWEGKQVHLITNGAKFINMPRNGFTRTQSFETDGGYYSKEESLCLFNFSVACENVIIDTLFVDGENYKMKYAAGITCKEGDNPRQNGKQYVEGRGHGVVFGGCKNVIINNLKSINHIVDGVAISFDADYGTMTVKQTTNFNITNLEASGCGRLGVSGLGMCSGNIVNLVAEYNALNKNSDGQYISYAPSGGVDIEPHHSPISMDNRLTTNYKTEDWNGSMSIQNARVRYNSNIQIACTSTLLTRNVVWERLTVRPVMSRVDSTHTLIQTSMQNCVFKDSDIDGLQKDGTTTSRFIAYAAGMVNEKTGVIAGQAAGVWSQVQGGRVANVDLWTNIQGNQTYNDAPVGEYGQHNVVFRDLIFDNVKMSLRSIRRFMFDNVVMNIPENSSITLQYAWNANMKNVVMLNKKSTAVTIDLGANDAQSTFENLRITTGKFNWASGTKKYKTGIIGSEGLDVYDYTHQLEYILSNSTGTPTEPKDTTPPSAPTVNTIYANSTTITGTAEANSTVKFTGGFTGQTTANGSGSFSIAVSGLVQGQTVNVTATDSAGNVSSVTSKVIQASTVDTTPPNKPTIDTVYTNSTAITGAAEANSTVTVTFNGTNAKTATATSGGTYSVSTTGVTLTSGMTISVTAKDAANNVSSAATATVQTVSSAPSNLIGAFTNTAAITEGWGKRKNLNSILSLNWNSNHGGIDGTKGWSVDKDQIKFTNLAHDGSTTGATSERYIYFKLENLKPSTVYTLGLDISYSSVDDITSFGGVQYGLGSTPKRITLSFKTDATGAYGYKWESDTRYGTKADGSALSALPDATFVNKVALKVNQTLTFEKIMLNEGATAQPYVAS